MTTRVKQMQFRNAVLDGSYKRPIGLKDGEGKIAGKRFDVYRNNIAVSLTEALMVGFPATVKLLGENNFKTLAGVYLRKHPPSSPVMMHYGEGFPEFIGTIDQLKHMGYLCDVAKLEFALRRSYHAADATPIAPNLIAAIPPIELNDVKFGFAPTVQLLSSPWPVHAIWAFNMAKGPKPKPVAQKVLILRAKFDPKPHVLTPEAGNCIAALMSGQSLGDVVEQATKQNNTEFDLSALLALLLAGNAITELRTKD
ncbi:HvfC/BufC N-terminal domain-containing protein [Pseudopelagicola sp. nBUS_19]|uniref:HvfC/BufC N-terminal domain-containing protein n=1 Tax=Pseudopelagicola sp. nBUS_19 TaxID=3395316 RepID=UPI003EC0E234